MKKTLITLFTLIVVSVFVFAACSPAEPAAEEPSVPAVEEEPSAEQEETEAPLAEEPSAEPEDAADAGATGNENLVIGIVMQDIIGQMGSDLRAAAYYQADQMGIQESNVKFIDGQSQLENQINGIDDLLAGGNLDAIIIWPSDDQGIAQSVIACNEAGVPVITMDVVSAGGDVLAHVASDNMEIGRIDGEFAVETLKKRNGAEEGVIIVSGLPQLNSMRERVDGFLEIVEQYPDIEIKTHDFAENTFEAGQALTDDLMQLYPEGSFDILYGANCAPGLGGVNSAATVGRTDFDVITVDNIPQFIEECEKGEENTVLRGFVAQDPIDIGMTAMELAVMAANGEDTGEYLHATNIELVTPTNVQAFLEKYNEMSALIDPFR